MKEIELNSEDSLFSKNEEGALKSENGDQKRVSYYVEENEKILNLLITNCEPILSEIVTQVNHFNSYNRIQKVVEKNGVNIEDIAILKDITVKGTLNS